MKQVLLAVIMLWLGFNVQAQSEKYMQMMTESIEKINYNASIETIQEAANTLERIGQAEKTEWLPNYYSTIAYITMASKDMENGGENIREYIEKAGTNLDEARRREGDASEILTAQGYLYLAHIWIDPMTNGAKYSTMAYEEFDEALKYNPENPRPYYLKGQNLFFTPEPFGGGKVNAKPLLETARQKFETFEPKSEIWPNWGEGTNNYFLSLCDEDAKEENTEEKSE